MRVKIVRCFFLLINVSAGVRKLGICGWRSINRSESFLGQFSSYALTPLQLPPKLLTPH